MGKYSVAVSVARVLNDLQKRKKERKTPTNAKFVNAFVGCN